MADPVPLLCPRCGGRVSRHDEDSAVCNQCGRRFPVVCRVIDLRSPLRPTCWSDARRIPDDELTGRLATLFPDHSLVDLVEEYASQHRLPVRLAASDRSYALSAREREEWTVLYMHFCFLRYTGQPLAGDLVLDAGCGSGGSLPHLVERFSHVVGQDRDLPSLVLASKRCSQLGIADRVTLVAASLEQRVFPESLFAAIKCTDVVEHLADPIDAYGRLIDALRMRGAVFLLTPNKLFLGPEPHVRLFGIQFLPRPIADWYATRRIGIPYRNIATLMTPGDLLRLLRTRSGVHVSFVPIEDKHLNPTSRRGRAIKRIFTVPPLKWLSRSVRFLQPTLEAVCVKTPDGQGVQGGSEPGSQEPFAPPGPSDAR